MKVEQRAGRIELVTYTDGWPLRTSMRYDGVEVEQLSTNDLHDLRYAVDRQLAQLPTHP